MEVARHRAIQLGMEVRDVVDACVFTVVMGFFIGHVFTVVAYFPERLSEDGIMSILRVWQGFSSFGGFMGAVLGAIIFFNYIRPRPFWRYADVVSFGFPFAWFLGRVGCGVVHDHIGRCTTFPLGMEFPAYRLADGSVAQACVRHELGLYEAAFMVAVAGAFWSLGRVDRPPGFFTGVFAVVYAPVRFGLDFLRNNDLDHQDVRYFNLTPAQWGCFVMLGLGVWVLSRIDWKGFQPWPMDGLPDQELRAKGLPVPTPAPEPPGAGGANA